MAANETLNKQRQQKVGCDLSIRIGNRTFAAHKKVLIEKLRFFRTRISIKQKDSTLILNPRNVDPEVFEDVLEYIYISQIKFTTANLEPVYRTASHLNFEDLLVEAEKAMKNASKTEKMIVVVMNIAQEYNLWSIESECIQTIISNPLSEVGKQHLIPALTFGHLKVLLKRIRDKKEEMFHLCVEWVRSDQTNRSGRLPELLQLIPLDQLSTEFLNETVLKHSIVRNNSESLLLLIEALKISKSKTTVNTKSHSASIHESKNLNSNGLYAIGGYDTMVLLTMSKFDFRTNSWIASPRMPVSRGNFGCTVHNRKIYICGGWEGTRAMNELTVYDPDTEQWTQLKPMKYARYECGMAALDGFLYVAGGYDGTKRISAVERYSVRDDQWETVTPLINVRCGLELVSMNGFLYAIGGQSTKIFVKSVERYSSRTNEWQEVASLNNKYDAFGSAVLNNRIYVAGGGNCEVYDSEKGKWESMKVPTKCDKGLKMAVYNNKLFAIGGGIENQQFVGMKRFERFDFEANCWVEEPDMDIARCFHGVAVVESS